MNIKAWIQGIGTGSPSPDLLTAFDATIDGSIGGLGNKMEKFYNSRRSAPLFEFRDLQLMPRASEFAGFMANVDSAIQKLHNTFGNPSRNLKRQDAFVCMLPTPTSGYSTSVPVTITPPPMPTCFLHFEDPDQGISQSYCLCNQTLTLTPLPIKTDKSDACAYDSIPGSTAAATIAIETEIWTSNCATCTLVGGITGNETCTTVAGCTPTGIRTSTSTGTPIPTIAAWVSNITTIDIRNADDGNGGIDLAVEMFNKLKGFCSRSGCTGDHAEMEDVEVILADGEEPLTPAMYFQVAQL